MQNFSFLSLFTDYDRWQNLNCRLRGISLPYPFNEHFFPYLCSCYEEHTRSFNSDKPPRQVLVVIRSLINSDRCGPFNHSSVKLKVSIGGGLFCKRTEPVIITIISVVHLSGKYHRQDKIKRSRVSKLVMPWITEAGTHPGHCQSIKSSTALELVRTTCIHVQGYPSGDLLIPLRISEPLLFLLVLMQSIFYMFHSLLEDSYIIYYFIIIVFILSLCEK